MGKTNEKVMVPLQYLFFLIISLSSEAEEASIKLFTLDFLSLVPTLGNGRRETNQYLGYIPQWTYPVY